MSAETSSAVVSQTSIAVGSITSMDTKAIAVPSQHSLSHASQSGGGGGVDMVIAPLPAPKRPAQTPQPGDVDPPAAKQQRTGAVTVTTRDGRILRELKVDPLAKYEDAADEYGVVYRKCPRCPDDVRDYKERSAYFYTNPRGRSGGFTGVCKTCTQQTLREGRIARSKSSREEIVIEDTDEPDDDNPLHRPLQTRSGIKLTRLVAPPRSNYLEAKDATGKMYRMCLSCPLAELEYKVLSPDNFYRSPHPKGFSGRCIACKKRAYQTSVQNTAAATVAVKPEIDKPPMANSGQDTAAAKPIVDKPPTAATTGGGGGGGGSGGDEPGQIVYRLPNGTALEPVPVSSQARYFDGKAPDGRIYRSCTHCSKTPDGWKWLCDTNFSRMPSATTAAAYKGTCKWCFAQRKRAGIYKSAPKKTEEKQKVLIMEGGDKLYLIAGSNGRRGRTKPNGKGEEWMQCDGELCKKANGKSTWAPLGDFCKPGSVSRHICADCAQEANSSAQAAEALTSLAAEAVPSPMAAVAAGGGGGGALPQTPPPPPIYQQSPVRPSPVPFPVNTDADSFESIVSAKAAQILAEADAIKRLTKQRNEQFQVVIAAKAALQAAKEADLQEQKRLTELMNSA